MQTNFNRFEQVNWIKNPDFKEQINLIGRFDGDNGATMLFIIEKSEEETSEFSHNSVTVVWFSQVCQI